MTRHLHAIVHGRVQMVGFRYFVLGHAERLGLSGWVRNGPDGQTVELVAEGDEPALRELETALHQGPPGAVVDSVDANWSADLEGLSGFSART